MSTSTKPIRVLALPGFGQTGDMMLGKMYKLRKVFGDDIDVVAMDPPMILGHPTVHFGAAQQPLTYEEEYLGWWRRDYTHSFKGDYEAFEFALRAFRNFVQEHGPFDAVIGFSQGGNALVHFLPLLEKPWLHPITSGLSHIYSPRTSISASSDDSTTSVSSAMSVSSSSPPLSPAATEFFGRSRQSSIGEEDVWPLRPFKCVVLVGAYGPADPLMDTWFDTPVTVPTLCYIGKNDAWIPPNHQVDTAAKFVNSKILWHIGGHFIPQAHEYHVAMRDFIVKHCS
ncbi:hypothetical protein Rhopal_006547-T1 [Rhodotorula paludigena]|uniref:Serine hydrolase domain-containing protein n=1 Tax=Rhodotorula paludigena TaxID=86838 RepID=A0AAV5GUB1_9BASI|nr:hypothetical protein Rhopal_006547-T1 [Rhodotorula paludigena]